NGDAVSEPVTPAKPGKEGGSTQINMFDAAVAAAIPNAGLSKVELTVDKNIHNTAHTYHLCDTVEKIDELLLLLTKEPQISFDTETTNIDAKLAELVGMSFSIKPGEGYYVPLSADKDATKQVLEKFAFLFQDLNKKWVGQNLKYDLLVLKWYGVELNGTIFDTMLAHYVIEPEGKRNMDFLSAKYLGYEPIPIESLIGKKGKTQGNMRDVEIEAAKEY